MSALVLAWTQLAAADCATDADCKNGRVCRSGRCEDASSCTKDTDCTGNQVCTAGACTTPTTTTKPVAPSATPVTPPPAHPARQKFVAYKAEHALTGAAGPGLSQPHAALVTGGIVSLSIGYGMALIGGAIATAVDSSQKSDLGGQSACLGAAPLNLIPLVGPSLFAASYPSYDVYSQGRSFYDCGGSRATVTALTTVSTLLQVVGVAMVVVGFVWRTREQAPSVAVLLGAPSALSGVTLKVSFL